jgi:hypothetical protein
VSNDAPRTSPADKKCRKNAAGDDERDADRDVLQELRYRFLVVPQCNHRCDDGSGD